MLLSASPRGPGPVSTDGEVRRARGKGRVLLVDDDPDVRELLTDQLEVEGWSVEQARDGREGLDVARAGAFDVIVLDHRMPRMTGEEMARALRAAGIRTPIVLVTADRHAAAIARRVGLRYWLTKPFDMDRLLELVRHARARGPLPAAAAE